MGKFNHWMMVFLFMLVLITYAHADTLLIQGIENEPPNSEQGLLRPTPGMSMDDVLNRFGQPKTQSASVGKPPIVRWTYDKFVVVFEYDRVIHAVVRKPSNERFAEQ
ncbi:MAG: hypothetical protein OEY38_06990 [Gammaproteobacteria bacterium]|nr:hypothetical protein [Gammaproteobacteria bacterium]